jgi:hypothetical protein
MGILLVVLLLALLLGGLGFALHVLWWIALIVLVVWLVGFVMRSTDSAGTRSRWYRW